MYSRESKKNQSLKVTVMKGVHRELKHSKTVAPADFLVCFPSRAHLALMPKQICSPSRPSDASTKRSHRSTTSPLFKSKTSSVIDEPTSPKVTCAGQIKVRPKSMSRTKTNTIGKKSKKIHWLESLAFKKDEFMQCIGSFRGLGFNMQCFGSFNHGVDGCSSDDEDEVVVAEEEEERSRNVFIAKWFMMLDEKEFLYDNEFKKKNLNGNDDQFHRQLQSKSTSEVVDRESSGPPANALMLMRSRSTPTKGWMRGGSDESCVGGELLKFSTEIAKETWVSGTSMDPLARSRSWKR